MDVRALAIEEVLFLHDLALRETGGRHGVRDFGMLHAAVERPRAQFGGTDIYPTIEDKAAAMVHSLVLSHPFVDGNKRTSAAALIRLLESNRVKHQISNHDLVDLISRVARKSIEISGIARWIRQRMQ